MISPPLTIDFTTASLDPRITFARALNTATRINASGLIEAVNSDSPRFDYDPTTLQCRGLLIEGAATNLLTYSEDLTNGAWLRVRSAPDVNNTTTLAGLITAYKLVEDNSPTSTTHYTYRAVSGLSAETYCWSVYAKADDRTQLTLRGDAGAPTFSIFNLSTGQVISQGAGHSAVITPMKDGVYRCSITMSVTGATWNFGVGIANANSATYIGDGTKGIYVSGAQLEIAARPTSYIPTTTGAVTRNADVATITGTNFSSFWQATRGGVLVRALPSTVSGTRPLVQVDDATADNIIALRGNTTNPELYIRAGGADQATIDAGTISAAAYRLAGSWKAGNGVATLNGFAPVKGTLASIPVATQMRLGSDGTNYLNGHLQSLEYWDEFLTPATLQSVTTSAGYRSIIGPVMRDAIIA